MIALPSATGTIDLVPASSVFSLASLPAIASANFTDLTTLVNQNGDILVNQSGYTLAMSSTRTVSTNMIDIGE